MFLKNLLLLYFFFLLEKTFALSATQQVCGNGTPCTASSINLLITQKFSLSTPLSSNLFTTEHFGNFNKIVFQNNALKNNMVFFTTRSSSITCTGSKGLIFEHNGDYRVLSEVIFTQSSATSCTLNFNKKISSTDLQKSITLVLAIGSGISSRVSEIDFLVTDAIIPAVLPNHVWSIKPNPLIHMGISIDLNIQSLNNNDLGCTLTGSQSNYKIQLADSMFIPNAVSCQFMASSVTTLSTNSWRAQFNMNQISYWGCSKQYSFLNQIHNYKMKIKPIISGCSYYENYPTYNPQVYIYQQVVKGPFGNIFYMTLSTSNI
jgi:hypothetical protein